MVGLRGIRGRLTATLVALVAATAAVLGIGSYLFVDLSLHDRLLADAAAQARFDLNVLIPRTLPEVTRQAVEDTKLSDTFAFRQVVLVPDFGGPEVADFRSRLPADALVAAARGDLGYAWLTFRGTPQLVVGGTLGGSSGPDRPVFWFIHDAGVIDEALGQLRVGLGGGALVLALVALLAARRVARGVLAPVEDAGRAAERIERGDLSARVPVTSRDEFGAWAERFNRMAAALEEALAENRRFVSDVAHELRTPLTALVAEASILREHLDDLPPEARRTGELLVDDVARLRGLVEELMELSRFDADAEHVTLQPTDLVRLVRAVVDTRHPEARVVAPDEPLVVATDPRRVERILVNLLDNAHEHANRAAVQVRLRSLDAGEVLLSVADGGPGVPEDRLERIFERFYKADPSRHGGSSGLGLAIAAENAALIGARLRARNRREGGLRVDLRLPASVTEPLRDGDPPAIRDPDRLAPEPTQEPSR